MSIPQAIERIDERLDAFEASLVLSLPNGRIVTREYKHYTERTDAELTAGVITILSDGEGEYSTQLGMVAKEGTQRIILLGHLRVAEEGTTADVQAVEIDLIEEIKTFARSKVAGVGLRLHSVKQSRQLEHPYGWVVAYIDAGPPNMNTH